MKERLAYIDGLRGIAVLMVVVFHAWQGQLGLRAFVGLGSAGVSLFLVLSGFCLSYPALKKRARGDAAWFGLRTFWIKRLWRILPPYYAALVMCTLTAVWAQHGGPSVPGFSAPVGQTNFLAHLLLVHNLIPADTFSIAGPFWSLALEWQWYCVFPAALVAVTRAPRWTLTAVFVVGIGWTIFSPLVWTGAAATTVPGRLFEFCCGIVAARLIVAQSVPRARWLLLVAVACLSTVTLWPVQLYVAGDLYYPICGAGFAAVLLAASCVPRMRAALSFSPLVGLGVISYSVYLIHNPALSAVTYGFSWLLGPLTAPVAAVVGIAAGWVFHLAVERRAITRSSAVGRVRVTPEPVPMLVAVDAS